MASNSVSKEKVNNSVMIVKIVLLLLILSLLSNLYISLVTSLDL